MGETTLLQLPYPELTDVADVPADLRALAEAIEGALPPYVTALPATPYDGQHVAYGAAPAAGVAWHLRYRAAAPAPYRWECLGGLPLLAEVNPGANLNGPTAGGAYIDIPASAGPALTIPLAGEYEIGYGGLISYVSGVSPAGVALAVARGATAPAAGEEIFVQVATGVAMAAYRTKRLVVSVPGQVLTQRYFISAATTVSFTNRSLRALPVRVG